MHCTMKATRWRIDRSGLFFLPNLYCAGTACELPVKTFDTAIVFGDLSFLLYSTDILAIGGHSPCDLDHWGYDLEWSKIEAKLSTFYSVIKIRGGVGGSWVAVSRSAWDTIYVWCGAVARLGVQHIFPANFSLRNFVPPDSQRWGSDVSQIWRADRPISGTFNVALGF